MAKLMGRHFKVNGIGILPAFGSLTLFGLDGKLNFLAISVLIIGFTEKRVQTAEMQKSAATIDVAGGLHSWPEY